MMKKNKNKTGINRKKTYATIYTDASYDAGTGFGYGGFRIQSETVSIRDNSYLGIVLDSNYAELTTILTALRRAVKEHDYKLNGALVYSDSKVAIESIESNMHPKYATIARVIKMFIKKQSMKIKFVHVKAHVAKGERSLQHAINDDCDKLARMEKYATRG